MFTLAILILEVVLLSKLDRRLFGTWVTPFNLLAYPYTLVVVLAFFFAPALDFVSLYTGSVLVWIVGLFIVWAAGAFLAWGLLGLGSADVTQAARTVPDDAEPAERLAMVLAWTMVPIMLYGLFAATSAVGGWSELGTQEFKDAYGRGLPAHAQELSGLFTILLIGLYRRGKTLQLLTIATSALFMTISQVKGHIIVVVIAGLLFRVLQGKLRLSVRNVTAVLCASFVAFSFPYLLAFLIVTPSLAFETDVYSYLGRHYCYYLFGSPLALGEALRSGTTQLGGDWTIMVAPFVNAYRTVTGNSNLIAGGASHELGVYVDTHAKALEAENVYTFFGTPYLYLGVAGATLYVLLVAFVCYGFLILVRRRRETWLTAAYCLIAAELVMGLFSLYFWLLTPYELTAFAIVLGICTRRYKRKVLPASPSLVTA